ncbi:hypothetical protein ACFY7F_06895 [Streptomyces griseofuscus]|uniref:hypothetical protein n=1 Tax=Streptomyces griseofuscus TaxID=146922 RepID=UPI003693839C
MPGALDLAVAGVAVRTPPPGLAWGLFVDVPLAVAAVPEHALMAAYPDGGAGAGFRLRPQVVFEAATPDALARLTARGLGVAVLLGPDPRPGLRALPSPTRAPAPARPSSGGPRGRWARPRGSCWAGCARSCPRRLEVDRNRAGTRVSCAGRRGSRCARR